MRDEATALHARAAAGVPPCEAGCTGRGVSGETRGVSERDLSDSTLDLPTLASAEALAVLPGYTLVRMLDETPVSRGYQCRSERTGEFVLVQLLQRAVAEDSAQNTRILRESRLLGAIKGNAHLLHIIDAGEGAAGTYVVSELPSWETLATRLEKGRIPVVDALTVARDVARALVGAHASGVIHRDITPARIHPARSGFILAGFSLASPLDAQGGEINLVGSAEVTAPELIAGAAADAQSDLYALGATLFWLITGKPMFEGSVAEILAAQQKKPVPSIASLVPDAGIAVVDILYRLLQKDPTRRPQSAQEVVDLLDGAIARIQRDSAAPSPALPRTSSSSMRAPKTGASPFDAVPATDDDPYVGQPTGVMGSLKQMGVAEIIQTLEIGKKSARVDIQPIHGEKATLHVHDGQLVHASTPTLAGERVIARLVDKKEGFFRIHYEKETCERNVTRPTQFVLLEAMRVLDEESRPMEPSLGAAPSTSVEFKRARSLPRPEPQAPAVPPHTPAPVNAVVVRRPDGLVAPPAAAPLGTPSSMRPPPAPAHSHALAQASGTSAERTDPVWDRSVEDVTAPQMPLHGARAAVAHAVRDTRRELEHLVAWVRREAPVWNAAAEQRFVPWRVRLAARFPRVGALPLWQLTLGAAVALLSVLVVLRSLVG